VMKYGVAVNACPARQGAREGILPAM